MRAWEGVLLSVRCRTLALILLLSTPAIVADLDFEFKLVQLIGLGLMKRHHTRCSRVENTISIETDF
jgi:hypothetical protein